MKGLVDERWDAPVFLGVDTHSDAHVAAALEIHAVRRQETGLDLGPQHRGRLRRARGLGARAR